MRDLRKLLCWLFAASSLLCVWNALKLIFRIIDLHYSFVGITSFLAVCFFPVLAVILAIAWWKVWKEKPSGWRWGIAASLTYILIALWLVIHFSVHLWHRPHPEVLLVIGFSGLIAFSWRDKPMLRKNED